MKTYLDCWVAAASALFSQALAGEPRLIEGNADELDRNALAYRAEISGDVSGDFTALLEPGITETPLLGEGIDQSGAWTELLREVAESAAGELLATSGKNCRVVDLRRVEGGQAITRAFRLESTGRSWSFGVCDGLSKVLESSGKIPDAHEDEGRNKLSGQSPGLELLLDVELEAAIRFGCCRMPLGEILEFGPGDVVELDRQITDPVDLIVSDKIVARGEVVVVNGNLGLRVTEVSTPQSRLESIRCLF
jgi:flagellar motor switch protein FliN